MKSVYSIQGISVSCHMHFPLANSFDRPVPYGTDYTHTHKGRTRIIVGNAVIITVIMHNGGNGKLTQCWPRLTSCQ